MQQNAATVGDMIICMQVTPVGTPHAPIPIPPQNGLPSVLICNKQAVNSGIPILCPGPIPHPVTIKLASQTVLICNSPAVRGLDITDAGMVQALGAINVFIG